jgi:hypothetical protein
MARLIDESRAPDGERGAVYVEFLIAFFPLFLLFLGICQLALVASAKLVVQHAALASARSAIVVLEAPPERFGDAPRGSLSKGNPSAVPGPEALLGRLQLTGGNLSLAPAYAGPQQGARMVPVRLSAYMPLLTLAPTARALNATSSDSLAKSLPDFSSQLGFALGYTRAATVVSVHTRADSDELAQEPVGSKAPVTVRVSYLYHCRVPLVRAMVCSSLRKLLGTDYRSSAGIQLESPTALAERMKLSEAPGAISQLAAPSDSFFVLTGEATLPNQGAAYDHPESS